MKSIKPHSLSFAPVYVPLDMALSLDVDLEALNAIGFGCDDGVMEKEINGHMQIDYALLALHDKYLMEGSPFDLNVADQIRQKQRKWYEDMQLDSEFRMQLTVVDRLNVLDDVILEVYRLMRSSFARFKDTSCFEECLQYLKRL